MRMAREIFVENLKAIRKNKGLTQVMLAELADLSSGLIGDIESGRRNPTLTTIEKIALALNVPVQQLFYNPENSIPEGVYETRDELKKLLHILIDKAFE